MPRNPVLDLPLHHVIRCDIALPLQQVLQIYTVGHFLRAWQEPRHHGPIAMLFDSPEQARQAVEVCATWLGVRVGPSSQPPAPWWAPESDRAAA